MMFGDRLLVYSFSVPVGFFSSVFGWGWSLMVRLPVYYLV